jgi:hypothetical protein
LQLCKRRHQGRRTDFAAATERALLLLLLKIRALPKKCRRDKDISKGSGCMEKEDYIFWGNSLIHPE